LGRKKRRRILISYFKRRKRGLVFPSERPFVFFLALVFFFLAAKDGSLRRLRQEGEGRRESLLTAVYLLRARGKIWQVKKRASRVFNRRKEEERGRKKALFRILPAEVGKGKKGGSLFFFPIGKATIYSCGRKRGRLV